MPLKTSSIKLTKIADIVSVRAKTLAEVWNSQEPTFNAVRNELGASNLKKLLLIEVGKMVLLLKADMQEQQIEYFVSYIIRWYPSYTISDITSLTDVLVKVKPYGKPTLQNLIYELDQYSIEKQEYAVEYRIKENSKHKAEHLKEDKFTKMYARLKEEAKVPKKTQKQKDEDARRINEEKIEQLQKQYPKTQK